MKSLRRKLEEALLEIAWSQWTEMGVRGTVRRHSSWSIDPESLLVLTALIADSDPRLRDESLDWCVEHHRYLSRNRTRNLLDRLGAEPRAAFERYSATLAAAGVRGWSGTGKPWPFEPTSKSTLADLRRPALVRIRLRAVFGVSARAEILHVLAWQASGRMTTGELAELAGYTKRNVGEELSGLERAGLVDAAVSGNRKALRLRDRGALERFIGPAPYRFPDWGQIASIAASLRELFDRFEDADRRVRDIEANRLIDELTTQLAASELPQPPHLGESAWERLGAWALTILSEHAGLPADHETPEKTT